MDGRLGRSRERVGRKETRDKICPSSICVDVIAPDRLPGLAINSDLYMPLRRLQDRFNFCFGNLKIPCP